MANGKRWGSPSGYIQWLRTLDNKIFEKIALREYCAIFDMCVQQGGIISSEKPEIKKALDKELAADHKGRIKKMLDIKGTAASGGKGKFRADCVSRRIGILDAKTTKVIRKDAVGKDITSARENKNYILLQTDKCIDDY